MEDLLASIRRAIHDDIGEMPSSTAGRSQGTLFKGAMRELRVRAGEETSAAAAEIQGLRDKIQRTQTGEILNSEPEAARPRRLASGPSPAVLRPSLAESTAGFWDDEPPGEDGYAARPGMLSREAEVTASNAFNQLAHTLLARRAEGQPIEDMTRELLRGLLKQWLDTNLPGLVERLVREEIERVARRGR